MDNDKPLFRYKTRVASTDPSGYYHTRWDKAVPVTVLANDADEAASKAKEAMGKADGGRQWAVSVDSADEIGVNHE